MNIARQDVLQQIIAALEEKLEDLLEEDTTGSPDIDYLLDDLEFYSQQLELL